jgi:putative endonuclease
MRNPEWVSHVRSGVALRCTAKVEQEAMYTVYAIYNTEAKKYYIGQSKDIVERLKLHNDHTFKSYTSRFPGEWKLIYQESVATRSEALIREKQLKSGNGRAFIKAHIRE